jgi:transcriptional regulator with XRE-family HTH domain
MTKRGDIHIVSYNIDPRPRKYLKARSLSQKELAEKIGISNSRVSNWEKGINRPDVDIPADICTALNVSPSVLPEVRLPPNDLSDIKRRVIMEYRKRPELQHVVNFLPGVETGRDPKAYEIFRFWTHFSSTAIYYPS